MDMKYHRLLPTSNNLQGFKAYDSIDFLLTGPGRALVNNSITVDFDLVVQQNGAALAGTELVQVNQHIGASAFFDQFQVETQNKGSIQNLQNYPRYCNLVNSGSKCDNDAFNSQDILEGVGPLLLNGRYAVQPDAYRSKNATVKTQNKHYVVTPKICFNRAQGGQFDFDKDGFIKISTTLSRVANCLWGVSVDENTSYTISNVSLRYQTIPKEQALKQPLLMNSYISIKSTLNSTNNMIQATVPTSACSGCAISFIEQSNEGTLTKDNNKMEVVRGIHSLRFLFDSSLSERITYELTDLKDMVYQGVEVLSQSGHNNVTFKNFKSNDSFLVGLDFKSYLDLSNTNFQVNIDMENSLNNAPLSAYLYFLNLIRF